MSEATLNKPSLEQINRDLAKTVAEEMQKVEILTQALRDILNPIGMMQRNVPEGHEFNARFAVQYADSPQCYKDIAKAALYKIGIGI